MTANIEPLFPLTKILIVDDDEHSLIAFTKVFGRLYKILSAASAQEGLEVLKQNPDIAVVVSDQRMPQMSGVDFLFHVKNIHPAISRVLITGYADLEAAIEAINKGTIYKYVFKPFDPEKTRDLLMDAVSYHFKTFQGLRLESHMQQLLREKTAKAMENYTAWVAHHVNNALQSIRTYVDLSLDDFGKDPERTEFGKTTQNYIRRLAEVVQQLRDIYSHGLERFAKGPLSTLLEFDNAALSTMVRDKKIVIKKEVREPDLQITADPIAIQEAIRRLVVNAIEASPVGATIEVKAAKHESDGHEAVMFLVKDHGKGISPEIKEKLFYPFMNVDGGDHPRGLGLTYVQSIVARHGGDIQVDTVIGKGTSVSFSLPIIQAQKEESELDRLARQKLKPNRD